MTKSGPGLMAPNKFNRATVPIRGRYSMGFKSKTAITAIFFKGQN
jgi:hypothetical protein